MLRTLALASVPVVALAIVWLRLESPAVGWEGIAVCALALTPAIVRPLWARIGTTAGAALVAAWLAFGVEPWNLLPAVDAEWLDPLATTADHGLLDFYDQAVPFDPAVRPEMHGLVLAGLFSATLALVLLLATGRPLLASALLVVTAGWPATLVEGHAEIAAGGLVLGAVLWLVLLAPGRSLRATVPGLVAGIAVIALAAAASTSGAISRDGTMNWRDWKLYRLGRPPVGVRYVWDANYRGIEFPAERTTVLRIRAPRRALYWRASTLDTFTDDRWIEHLLPVELSPGAGSVLGDKLLPRRAADERAWVRQDVAVESLDDDHVIGAATPMRVESRSLDRLFVLEGGVAKVLRRLRRGQRYTVWSFAPRPTPAQLRAVRPVYPPEVGRYLGLVRGRLPSFAAQGRSRAVEALFRDDRYRALWPYRPVWQQARRLAASARTPYDATLAVERWLRADGGFRYDEQPLNARTRALLVDFVVRGRAGYCQHFAGTMALMLRFLGIPARVAVGFTSGTWKEGVWSVTDHEAHAWVEAWFDGWGWLAFDPTPGRGTISASYTFASDSADAINALYGRRVLDPGETLGGPTVPGPVQRGEDGGRDPWALLALVAAVAGLAVVVGLAKLARRRARYLGGDPRRGASAARAELIDWLRDQGVEVTPGTTLRELTTLLESALDVSGRAFATAVGKARYGPPDSSREAAEDARRELRLLLHALRAGLSRRRRLRGYLAFRSLRS